MTQQPLIGKVTGPLHPGRTVQIAAVNDSQATTREYYVNTEADALLVSLWVGSATGNVDVSVFTLTDELDTTKQLLLTTFPTISSGSTPLLLKKSVNILSRAKIRVVTAGPAVYEIFARGVQAAESSVRVLGASNGTATATTASTTAAVLIPAALTDRTGLIVKNNSTDKIVYLGFSEAEADPSVGYPLSAGESLGMDISSGADIWGVASSGTANIRILQAGN